MRPGDGAKPLRTAAERMLHVEDRAAIAVIGPGRGPVVGYRDEAWAEIDPDANGLAPISDLANVLNALPPPMGFKGKGGAWNTARVKRYIESLKLIE